MRALYTSLLDNRLVIVFSLNANESLKKIIKSNGFAWIDQEGKVATVEISHIEDGADFQRITITDDIWIEAQVANNEVILRTFDRSECS